MPRKRHLAPAELQLACVGAELIADFAAQQLVAGNIEVLAFDVPQSYIDGCDAGEDDRPPFWPQNVRLYMVSQMNSVRSDPYR